MKEAGEECRSCGDFKSAGDGALSAKKGRSSRLGEEGQEDREEEREREREVCLLTECVTPPSSPLGKGRAVCSFCVCG